MKQLYAILMLIAAIVMLVSLIWWVYDLVWGTRRVPTSTFWVLGSAGTFIILSRTYNMLPEKGNKCDQQ